MKLVIIEGINVIGTIEDSRTEFKIKRIGADKNGSWEVRSKGSEFND